MALLLNNLVPSRFFNVCSITLVSLSKPEFIQLLDVFMFSALLSLATNHLGEQTNLVSGKLSQLKLTLEVSLVIISAEKITQTHLKQLPSVPYNPRAGRARG